MKLPCLLRAAWLAVPQVLTPLPPAASAVVTLKPVFALPARVIAHAGTHHDWEDFSRERLLAGGSLQTYYPLHEDARGEYELWRKAKLPR